jgi:hypothetical protein
VLEFLQGILEQVSPHLATPLKLLLLGLFILLVLILCILGIVWLLRLLWNQLTVLWSEKIQPADRKLQREKYRRFARHIEREIWRLNSLEAWSDYRFTELEAEVEAEGARRISRFIPFLQRSGLRREPSLSKALESSKERLILLEGDPGSGKSVALRHVALMMAQNAIKALPNVPRIPIYINLKELDRHDIPRPTANLSQNDAHINLRALREQLTTLFNDGELHTLCFDMRIDYESLPGDGKADRARELVAHCERNNRTLQLVEMVQTLRSETAKDRLFLPPSSEKEAVNRDLIYNFVQRSLNRANDRDIEAFLEEEFEAGLRAGTWVFLFDSFDELPDILSSTETDRIIREYADAISDFLGGMNACRGIIASRYFRGPGGLGWPRFRILELTEKRCLELIRRAELKREVEHQLVGQLGVATDEIRAMVSNPMFLGLLCEHVREGNPFPDNSHMVFETFIENRLQRDKQRLHRRFALETPAVRRSAEQVAFCMAAEQGLGLSPDREDITAAMFQQGFPPPPTFETHLNALEFIKLARAETATGVEESRSFTFAHRRFQEYFATCVVLREPERVTPTQLLTDARWRETAVVMCQSQPVEELAPLLAEAHRLLDQMVATLPDPVHDPLEYVRAAEEDDADQFDDETVAEIPGSEPFRWPPGALHLLGLLQDGFGRRLNSLPEDIRSNAARLVLASHSSGLLPDKKWGVEVAGIVPQPVLRWLLKDAFAAKSQWLKEVAYMQTARLGKMPEDIARAIRLALRDMLLDGRLKRDRHATTAHLSRLDNAAHFLSVQRLLTSVPLVDMVIHLLFMLVFYLAFVARPALWKMSTTTTRVSEILLVHEISLMYLLVPVWGLVVFSGLMSIMLVREEYIKMKLFSISFYRLLFLGMISFLLIHYTFQAHTSSSILLLTPSPPGLFAYLSLLLFAYLLTWSLAALLVSAPAGRLLHPGWWFVLPILAPSLALFDVVLVVSSKKTLQRYWKTILRWIRSKDWWKVIRATIQELAILVIIANILVLSIQYVSTLPEQQKESITFIIGVCATSLFVWLVYPIFRSPMHFSWWRRKKHGAMDVQALLQAVRQYTPTATQIECLRHIRRQDLLLANEQTEADLTKLVLAVENGLALRNTPAEVDEWVDQGIILIANPFIIAHTRHFLHIRHLLRTRSKRNNPTTPEPFDHVLAEYIRKGGKKRILVKSGYELLDELCMLLEQVRSRRKYRES